LKIFSGKLKSRWSSPFTITEVFPYGTAELSQPNGPNFKVNRHQINHYHGGDIPALDVPNLRLSPMNNEIRGYPFLLDGLPIIVKTTVLVFNPPTFGL
ncbi:hypothetical protein Tco_1170259, partial [Tanacetum coccineum]